MRLGASFPTRALLAARAHHGVGVISLQTDYIRVCASSLTRALNDVDADGASSALALTTRALLRRQMSDWGSLPAEQRAFNTLYTHAFPLKQLSLIHRSGFFARWQGQVVSLTGDALWHSATSVLRSISTSVDQLPRSVMQPLWGLGIHDLRPLMQSSSERPTLIDTTALVTHWPHAAEAHRRALNRLTLVLTGTSVRSARRNNKVTPLPESARRLAHGVAAPSASLGSPPGLCPGASSPMDADWASANASVPSPLRRSTCSALSALRFA